jgi:adenine-specific DNA-methyltransferase
MHLNDESGANRRFVLIEQGAPERGDSYAQTLLANRLQRAISGDWASGPRSELPGGFTFHKLHKKVDAQAVLSMERDELAETIIASYGDGSSRRREALVTTVSAQGYKHLVARNADGEGFFLVWNGTPDSVNFTEEVYEACAEEAARAGLQPRYHVYARLYLFQTDNVVFYTIPDRILMDFGLDLRGEPYYEHEQ